VTALLLALPALSLLVLGAHFLRAGVPVAVLGALVTLVLSSCVGAGPPGWSRPCCRWGSWSGSGQLWP
jgi:hypothetical protein